MLLSECFYSFVVENSGLLGCDAVLLGECFYSCVLGCNCSVGCFYSSADEYSGVVGCDAALLGVSIMV